MGLTMYSSKGERTTSSLGRQIKFLEAKEKKSMKTQSKLKIELPNQEMAKGG